MATWDTLPIFIALPLALAAACMSGDGYARQQVSIYLTEILEAHAADLGGDPGYLLGMDTDAVWPLPARTDTSATGS